MDKKLLNDYARLIAREGGHVTKGDIVWVNAGLDQPEFVTMVVEECYKAGAKDVTVYWSHNPVTKLHYQYETVGNLSKVNPIQLAKFKFWEKKLPTMIHIVSDDPDAMKGVNQKKVSAAMAKRYPKIKKRFARNAAYLANSETMLLGLWSRLAMKQ